MTREEAIKELESGYPKDDTPTEECVRYEQAVKMAIEALKREKRALQLKSIVRNIDGWQNIVNEVARLEAEEKKKEGEAK